MLKNSDRANNRGYTGIVILKSIVLPITLLCTLIFSVQGQSYTYLALSSKSQKQIANARKNIDKNIEQEKIISSNAGRTDEVTEKLIPIYRERIANYRTIYETYSSHIYEFWTKFKGEPEEISAAVDYSSQARDIYIAAQNELNETDRVQHANGKLRILKSANEKFRRSIELIEKAYEIYRSTPLESDENTKLRNKQRNDSLQKAIRTQHAAVAADAWHHEVSGPEETGSNSHTNGNVLTLSENITPYFPEDRNTETHHFLNVTPAISKKKHRPVPQSSSDKIFSHYWVQIAACRVPLSKRQLAELVSDTLHVVEKLADHWYKYRIGPFDYEQAYSFRIRCGIKGAFIVKERK